MSDSEYNKQIEIVASMMKKDNILLDENDVSKLSKYHEYAKSEFNLDDTTTKKLIEESLIYLKLQSTDMDPLSDSEKFGVGFS